MPARRPTIICLPDTTSLIHLSEVVISGRDARLWLWDEFDVKVSDEIPREAARHPVLMRGQVSGKLSRSVETIQLGLERMERGFLDPMGISFYAQDDYGERHNCQLSLQLIVQDIARQVIFLTDELKIMRENTGFLKRLFDTYPIGMVWNSLDFLLYIHLRHPNRFLFPQAEDAMREVNIRIGGTTSAIVSRLANYTTRLRYIDTARTRIPTLWRNQ